MSVSSRRQLINRKHEKISLVRQCQLLHVTRSSLYYNKSGESSRNLELMAAIDREFIERPFMGYRQMSIFLAGKGYQAGEKRVRRLMRLMGLTAVYRKPRTSIPNSEHKRYPYLLRGVTVSRCNQVWSTDITYIPMRKGYLYLVAIMDWYSRKVLSWRLSSTMDVDFCISALEEAIRHYGCPEIFNTDQGSQFTSSAFTDVLKEHGIAISMDGRGRWRDNVFIERLWRSLKYEEVYLHAYETGSEARKGIGNWIKFYNNERPHSAHNGCTPEAVYRRWSSLAA